MIYYWLYDNDEFKEINSLEKFLRLQFMQNFMYAKTIQHVSEEVTFGADGRYETDYFIKKVEEWKLK